MEQNNIQNSIAKLVQEKIKRGEVKMRSKIRFILKTFFIALGVFTIALFIFYLISLITFAMRASGVWYLRSFGLTGFKTGLILAPWLLIMLALFLIFALEILLKKFSFAYKKPLLYSLIAVLVIVFLGSFLVSKTNLHHSFLQRTKEGHLPIMDRVYRGFAMPKPEGLHRGIVKNVTENSFEIETMRNEILTVIVSNETVFPFRKEVKENDIVVILGKRNGNAVNALGIRKVNDKINFRPNTKPRPF